MCIKYLNKDYQIGYLLFFESRLIKIETKDVGQKQFLYFSKKKKIQIKWLIYFQFFHRMDPFFRFHLTEIKNIIALKLFFKSMLNEIAWACDKYFLYGRIITYY